MSLSLAALESLISTGATVEQLAGLLRTEIIEREQTDRDRKAAAAERKRRSRLSRDVTGQDVTSQSVTLLPPKPPIITNTLFPDSESKTETKKTKTRTSRGTRVPDTELPPEWAIAANDARDRRNMGRLHRSVLVLRWEDFQNYWRSKSGRAGVMLDWRGTWINNITDTRFENRNAGSSAATASRPNSMGPQA